MSVNNPYDKPNSRMGLSQKALAGRQTAKVWIGKYLQSDANTNYPATFGELTVEYLEEENMTIFFECIGLWLATGNFPTRQNTFLTVDVKVEYFKLIKEVLKETFSSHYLFQPNHPNEWYEDLMNRFKKECKRSRCEDPTVFDVLVKQNITGIQRPESCWCTPQWLVSSANGFSSF
jgi:hypothetical protein